MIVEGQEDTWPLPDPADSALNPVPQPQKVPHERPTPNLHLVDRGEPDVVMACAGDVPTLETLAAVRVVNVVDLMVLQPQSEHPHGLTDHVFDTLFSTDKPVIDLDRYQLALDASRRIPRLAGQVDAETTRHGATMERHQRQISEPGDGMPEVCDWQWRC